MPANYVIPDVAADLVADVAKVLSNSPSSMNVDQLAECYVGQFGGEYVRRAVVASAQIGLAELTSSGYVCSESHRDILRKTNKSELKLAFRGGLQNYGPFLLYADYLSKAFTSSEAASRTKGIFHIQTSPEKVERVLKGWGKYADLIEESGKSLKIKVHTENLLIDYARKLVDSLKAELEAKLFTIDMLGPDIFAYLDKNDIKLDDMARALRNYETDPKPSAARSTDIYERFVYTIALERGVNVQKPRGLMDWIDGLHSKEDLANNLWHFCRGMVGIRNMTHHNPDSETGQPWTISMKAALTSTLLVSIAIRSMYLYIIQRKQEF